MIDNILHAREQRAHHIEEWNRQGQSVLVLKLNVVGAEKNIQRMQFLLNFFHHELVKLFAYHIKKYEFITSLDGDYYIYLLDEKGRLIKERTILLEDHNLLGRLIDLDVYDDGSISRTDLSCELRTCLICDEYAHMCARSKKHSEDEIFAKVNHMIDEYLIHHITSETVKAMYEELELYPKFGLVSSHDSGCHSDMTYETFVQSIFALKPYIRKYIEIGLDKDRDPLNLKHVGQEAEQAMFAATNGTNTHKGLIFILGIFLDGLVKTILMNESKKFLQETMAKSAKQIIGSYYEDLSLKDDYTHGDQIYNNYGLKGVRGEALKGFPLIFKIPAYDEVHGECKIHEYLIHLMSELDDTTIIHKTNYQTLNDVKKDMQSVLSSGGYCKNQETINRLSKEYSEQNISPGGSADLLVMKIIYEDMKIFLHDE